MRKVVLQSLSLVLTIGMLASCAVSPFSGKHYRHRDYVKVDPVATAQNKSNGEKTLTASQKITSSNDEEGKASQVITERPETNSTNITTETIKVSPRVETSIPDNKTEKQQQEDQLIGNTTQQNPIPVPAKRNEQNQTDRNNTTSDDMFILALIFAILIPPVGVAIYEGITGRFWISLLLTLLFFLPGMIYAILVVTGTI